MLIRVRINRPLSSDRTPAGTTFDGIVANDVTAGGEVAIPRGAAVEGRVLSAEKSGALKGRGEMQIQLTQVTLGGKNYALVSDVWDHHGGDKTIETINKTAGLGAVGAVFGALAGGGVGAAVGGGVGAALGLGSSAASGNGQVYIPSETMLTFHTAQDTPVTTVSEQEMQRLAYGVPAGAQRAVRRPYPAYGPGPYPGYNPGPYSQYGYRNLLTRYLLWTPRGGGGSHKANGCNTLAGMTPLKSCIQMTYWKVVKTKRLRPLRRFGPKLANFLDLLIG